MTGGERIHAALTAGNPPATSVGTKVRQDAADEQDGYAFIIFRRVDVVRERGLGGMLLAMKEVFHIECWGETRADADVLEQEALAALTAANFYPDGNEVDAIDPEVKVRCAIFAVDVWTTPEIVSEITVEPT